MVGDFGEVVLLDWGLSKVIVKGHGRRSTSGAGRPCMDRYGTPAYMAPEQAGGLINQVNERTDVYGLGAILYHLLTLRPPFVGKSNREIVGRVLQEDVVPPMDRAPSRNISPQLNAICMRCLSRARINATRTPMHSPRPFEYLDEPPPCEASQQKSMMRARSVYLHRPVWQPSLDTRVSSKTPH